MMFHNMNGVYSILMFALCTRGDGAGRIVNMKSSGSLYHDLRVYRGPLLYFLNMFFLFTHPDYPNQNRFFSFKIGTNSEVSYNFAYFP